MTPDLLAENERLRALLMALPDRIKAECEAQAKRHSHPEEAEYRAGIRWGGQVGYNAAKEAAKRHAEPERPPTRTGRGAATVCAD